MLEADARARRSARASAALVALCADRGGVACRRRPPTPAPGPVPAPAPTQPAARRLRRERRRPPPRRRKRRKPSASRRCRSPAAAPDDVQERRNSTAAKIIIGREEIDRFGDSTLGDVLKRLPGVTIQGRPGRGGAIRLRGLGNGYTQILLDGERVPPGFSLDSLVARPDRADRDPARADRRDRRARDRRHDQHRHARRLHAARQRRAPRRRRSRTAGCSRRRRGRATSPPATSSSTTRCRAFHIDRDNGSTTTTVDRRLDDGARHARRSVDDGTAARSVGGGLHATARLQWRARGRRRLADRSRRSCSPPLPSRRAGALDADRRRDPGAVRRSATTTARGGTRWPASTRNGRSGSRRTARVETRAGVGRSRQPVHSFRSETHQRQRRRARSRTRADSHDTHGHARAAS